MSAPVVDNPSPVRHAVPAVEPDDLDEADLGRLFRSARPHPRLHQIPDVLRPWVLPVEWDREVLWSIGRPSRPVALADLRWHHPLPWWRGGDGRWFQVSPAAYMADPARFPEHRERIASLDPGHPLRAVRRRGRVQILDGIHRLVRAEIDGRSHLEVIFLDLDDLRAVVSPRR